MGQAANTGRRAELDDRKRRAAGRLNDRSPEIEQIRDFQQPQHIRGATGGAFGREGMSNRMGGSDAQPQAKDSHLTTGHSSKPARKFDA